ncbi:MAG: hypothetical protein E7616_07745 [Ruminococcaceae bacterium]|nr:hypothetical protein [Oscillospiraceae bacterium]
MYYCDKCSVLSEGTHCLVCGAHNLRTVKEDDFCFVTEAEEFFSKMFIESLKNEGIDCVSTPVGNGVRSALGLSLGGYRIYVPYRNYDAASEMLAFFANEESFENTLKEDILNNIDKWHFESGSTEKKIRKKYDLGKEVNVIAFIKERVQQAQSIEDVGLMSDGEHGLRVKSGNVTVWFSGESFKISI